MLLVELILVPHANALIERCAHVESWKGEYPSATHINHDFHPSVLSLMWIIRLKSYSYHKRS